jgi:hypothetical protein
MLQFVLTAREGPTWRDTGQLAEPDSVAARASNPRRGSASVCLNSKTRVSNDVKTGENAALLNRR